MAALPKISETNLDIISRSIADAVSHKQLSNLFLDCGIDEVGGTPRWERIYHALSARQKQDHCGSNVINFVSKVMHPSRFAGRIDEFEEFRNSVNTQLAFCGLHIGEDGKPQSIPKAETLPKAEQRANELQAELRRRAVHPDVMKFCRAEYLQQNYFHCVLEASKSLAQKLRDKTGLTSDGAELVQKAFAVGNPLLAVNSLQTDSEKKEQTGFSNLLKGIFGTFRNVTAHAPKIHWAVNKQDALDVLTIISYAHRRLNEAIVVPKPVS